MVSVLWEREEQAWVLHLRSGADREIPLTVGPFHVLVGVGPGGDVAWMRIFDDPMDDHPGLADLDIGWAADEGVVEFRLRRVPDRGNGHVAGVRLTTDAGEGILYVGWQEHPAKRLCAVGVGEALASADLYPDAKR